MPSRLRSATYCLLAVSASCAGTCVGEVRDQTQFVLMDFNRQTLLARFDDDQDGKFNQAERIALRKSFGEMDVPALPSPTLQYVARQAPPGVGTVWNALDNTPEDNPLSDAGATLGRVLFYDKRLSRNDTIACASCHHQEDAFADRRKVSVGFEGGKTGRNAMGLGYLRYTRIKGSGPGFFWDERATTLEHQVLMPIQDHVEMGMSLASLEQKLQGLPYYPPLFEAAFRSKQVTSEKIARAVAQFMRSMVSFDSKFDRAARAAGGTDLTRDFEGFSAEENLGKSLFIDGVDDIAEIGCAHCHVPPTFGMPKSFNNGLEPHYVDLGLGARRIPNNDPFTPSNEGKFKASSLRNIALTAPYMHDGRFETLEQVVEHYSSGVHPHPNLGLAFNADSDAGNTEGDDAGGKETSGFRLTRAQKSALIAFMKTLTDVELISDPKFSDPFVRP